MEQRPFLHRISRRFDQVQDVYEMRKNLGRRAFLEGHLPHRAVGAELGVHKGHLTPHLVQWTDARKVYAVDPWYLLGPTWEWAAGKKSTVDGLIRALRRSQAYIPSGRVEVVVADDCEWLAALPDRHLDWVYLDSSHEYEHTLREMRLLLTKVRVGGVIAGDDWNSNPDHRHYGVARAVGEFVGENNFATVLAIDPSTKQWAVTVNEPEASSTPD